MHTIAQLCRTHSRSCILVIAAPAALQEPLDMIAAVAASDAEKAETLFREFVQMCLQLCTRYDLEDLIAHVTEQTDNLYDLINGVIRIRECSPRSFDCIRSYGVLLATELCAKILQKHAISVVVHHARDYIMFDNPRGNVLFSETYARLGAFPTTDAMVHLVNGGLGSVQKDNAITFLGAQGADLTASLFAVSQRATNLTLLGGEPGIFVVDPTLISGAPIISELSMHEALELTYFGDQTIHSEALIPLEEHPIDVYINSIEDTKGGTWIRWNLPSTEASIRGISVVQGLALVVIEGRGMRGVRGMASKMFSALAERSINVTMIIQTASEQNICIVCKTVQAERAKQALQEILQKEISGHRVSHISITKDLAIMGVVGSQMRGQYGIAGAIFSSLGAAKINVIAIAQGSSELNISFVIDANDIERAAKTLYERFFHGAS